MKIKKTEIKNSFKFSKKFFSVIFLLSIFLFIFLISFFYGIHIYKTGQYYPIRMFLHRVRHGNFTFIKNYFVGKTSDIDQFYIDIKDINLKKLQYYRKLALEQNKITDNLQKPVSAKIKYKGNSYKVSLSLTGETIEHVQQPERWSLYVKVKNGKTIMGMKKFAILVPLSRGYLTDWIAHKMLKARDCIILKKDFINVNINGKKIGLYYLEERFDKLLVESNRFREGIIFKIIDTNLKIYNEKKIYKNANMSKQLAKLNELWYNFLDNKIGAEQLFDMQKLAATAVVTDIMNEKHALFFDNLRFYFNPITLKAEPIAREWGVMQKESEAPFAALLIENPNSKNVSGPHRLILQNPIAKKIFFNMNFYEAYIKEAKIIMQKSFLDNILKTNKEELDELLKKIYHQNPYYEFPLDILYKNQKAMRDKFNFDYKNLISITYNEKVKNTYSFKIKNKIQFPVEIHYYTYKGKKYFFKNRILIKPNYLLKNDSQMLKIKMPFNNVIISNILFYYSVLGDDALKKIIPLKKMKISQYKAINPTIPTNDFKKFKFISVKGEKIYLKSCVLKEKLIIPKDYTVIVNKGTNIDIRSGGKIVSYSPFFCNGEKDSMISFFSSDRKGEGLVFIDADSSYFNYVSFFDLTNVTEFGWYLSGSITFYKSPVTFVNCLFKHNFIGDDLLNIVKSKFSILNSTFVKSNADAFDSDFSNGIIENSTFRQIGNDAIDISGTDLLVKSIYLTEVADKGLSAGEKSEIRGSNIKISNSEIAVCSKDLSSINISNLDLINNRIAFTAFQKKPEYGPAHIIAKNVNIKNSEISFLIENKSSCKVNGVNEKSNSDKVKSLLYGVKYGKSSHH